MSTELGGGTLKAVFPLDSWKIYFCRCVMWKNNFKCRRLISNGAISLQVEYFFLSVVSHEWGQYVMRHGGNFIYGQRICKDTVFLIRGQRLQYQETLSSCCWDLQQNWAITDKTDSGGLLNQRNNQFWYQLFLRPMVGLKSYARPDGLKDSFHIFSPFFSVHTTLSLFFQDVNL